MSARCASGRSKLPTTMTSFARRFRVRRSSVVRARCGATERCCRSRATAWWIATLALRRSCAPTTSAAPSGCGTSGSRTTRSIQRSRSRTDPSRSPAPVHASWVSRCWRAPRPATWPARSPRTPPRLDSKRASSFHPTSSRPRSLAPRSTSRRSSPSTATTTTSTA